MSAKIFDFQDAVADAMADHDLSDRPQIRFENGNISASADAVLDVLMNGPRRIYQRGGELVYVCIGDAGSPIINPVRNENLIDWSGQQADFFKWSGRAQNYVPCDVPQDVAKVIQSRKDSWPFPELVGVSSTPTMRVDGTIFQKEGYDPATRMLLLNPPKMPQISDSPSRADALAGVGMLESLFAETPFASEADKAVMLSGLLSTVGRAAMSVVPCHAANAHTAGTGKSYGCDIIGSVALGHKPAVMSIGKTEEETGKRIGAKLLNGSVMPIFDNVNGEFGGDDLCQIIERPIPEIRVLGESRIVTLPNNWTLFATGNNMQIVGDMTRRVLVCNLDAGVERPELRPFLKNPVEMVRADRGKYIAAALTIMRAYAVAGFPDQALPALASFEDWSKMVRSALIWAGCADPCDTMLSGRDSDPERATLATFCAIMGDAGEVWRSAGQIAHIANGGGQWTQSVHRDALKYALLDVAENKAGGAVCPKRLGQWLKKIQGKIADGRKVVSRPDSHTKVKNWRVEQA